MNDALIQTLLQASTRLKTPIWFVGGPVRDELLGRPCDDWDMVCRKAKAVAQATAKKLRAKFIVLDEQNKIYRVILASPPAPLPSGEGDRRPGEAVIKTLDFAELQGKTIEEDLGRRDFTINAMAQSLTRPFGALSLGERVGVRQIIDPYNGRRDLKRKSICAVSERAFREDPLRLVRAFRFSAQFQFAIDPQTLKWIKKYKDSLSRVSPERVREEMLRLWKQPQSSSSLRLMDRTRLLSQIFPEIEACRRTAVRYYGAGGVLKHSFETVENLEWILERIDEGKKRSREEGGWLPALSSSLHPYFNALIGAYPRVAWLKWAAFLHDVGKPGTAKMFKGRLRFFEHEHVGASLAGKVGERLRCSRQEIQLMSSWVRHHMRTGSLAAAPHITDKALSRFFRDLGDEGIGMVFISLADHFTYLSRKKWGKGTDSVEKISKKLVTLFYQERSKILPERLVDGHALMKKLDIKPGPEIGRLLEEIQDAQAEGKVRTKEEAIAFAGRCHRAKGKAAA